MKNLKFYYYLYKHFFQYRGKNAISWNENKQEIPKIIHYCWFGKNPVPPLMEKCMESWREKLPEYKLQLWNEDNFPFEKYPFAAQAYEQKKWAFASDVARLHALYQYGGIYLDTDVEVLRSMEPLLQHGAFSGYESPNLISTCILGAQKGHPWIHLLLSWYDTLHFDDIDKTTANTRIVSKLTQLHYSVTLNGQPFILPEQDIHMYSAEWFCPRNEITENSICIHHFAGSWKD